MESCWRRLAWSRDREGLRIFPEGPCQLVDFHSFVVAKAPAWDAAGENDQYTGALSSKILDAYDLYVLNESDKYFRLLQIYCLNTFVCNL